MTHLDYEASRGFPGAVGVLSSQAAEVWLLLQSSTSSDAHPVVSTRIPGSRGPPQAWPPTADPPQCCHSKRCPYNIMHVLIQQHHKSTKKM